MSKEERKRAAEDASSSDDDVGPLPGPAGGDSTKRRKTLQYEKLYLDQLPRADRYVKSLMHRDTINFVQVTPHTDFVITTSVDGHVKFWKKQSSSIEFVKHYNAHLSMIVAVATSADGAYFASAAADGSIKVFDVINFDLIHMFQVPYTPRACAWVHRRGSVDTVLAVAEEHSSHIHFYDGRDSDGTPLFSSTKVHKNPCHILAYNEPYDCIVSADTSGMVEYWQPREPYVMPQGLFSLKSNTDLFEFKRTKSVPATLTFSPDFQRFATTSTCDRQVRVFDFQHGKLLRKYDESLAAVQEMQQANTTIYQLDDMEFGRRLAVERDIDASTLPGLGDAVANATGAGTANAVFDQSGNFIMYGTMLGIKMVNLKTNKVARLLGKEETMRFMNVSLYQGVPIKKFTTNIALAVSNNPLAKPDEQDPTLFCTAFKRARFYMFTKNEPDTDPTSKLAGQDRDIFNEKPTREEQAIASENPGAKKKHVITSAILHTTAGDIHLQLYPQLVPKTVENFVGLAKKGYYNGVIFHRVIKKFMIQTGDPLGDGTGGESLWGGEFEDEFVKELRHDRPYTLSMANAGRNTNASQFFITTVPTPWLDNKHTVFGRATGGLDVIHKIENASINKFDKPKEDIQIFSISLH